MDGWVTPVNNLPFTRDSSGTSSSNTGPSTGADGSVWYMYAETSSPNYPTGTFDMQKTFPAGQELYGVAFQYHKYGDTMGSAVLESSADGTTWSNLWSKSGNLGNQWNQASVYAVSSGQTMLRFTYTSGSSFTGDLALDNIQLGDCLTVGCSSSPNSPCIVPDGTCDIATGRCSVVPDGTPCDPATMR